jgi:predicted dithiol-disulfide oxidoreductase (DUF899 family)
MATTDLHDKRLPNEIAEYRTARNELLKAENSRRDQIKRVAAIAWPLWGLLDMTRSGRHPTMGPKLRY